VKITEIEVDSFGHWKGLQIPEVSPRVTVIYGPNEAGKSTLLHLIRAVLYGFSVRHHARFVPPRHPGHVGGKLKVATTNGKFLVRRWLPDPGPLLQDQAGDVSVQALSGGLQGRHLLPTLLAGVDDAIFRNVFAVGLSEMQQLGTLSDTEAAHQLYGLAAGADRVSIAEISRHLTTARARILESADARSIGHLQQQRDQLRSELDQERAITPRWLKLFDEQRTVNAEIARLEEERRRFHPELALATSRQSLRARWKDCRRLHQKLAALGPVPEIPSEVVQRLEATAKQIAEHRQAWLKLRERRRQLKGQARDLEVNTALLEQADQIQALQQRSGSLKGITGQIAKLKSQAEEADFALLEELERLGLKTQWRVDTLPPITAEMIDDLREPAREAREAREQSEAAERIQQEGEQAAEKLQRQLAAALNDISQPDLTTALQRLDKQIEVLRQRISLQGRVDSTNRRLKELRQEYKECVNGETLPWRGLMMLGIVFSLGIMLMLVAVFGQFFQNTADQRWTLALIGTVISGGALALKGLIEFVAGRGAAGCRNEMASMRKQITRLSADVQRLEPQLPSGSEPFAVRLQRVEAERQKLSDLQPLETQRIAALERVQRAVEQKEVAARRQRDARDLWRRKMRHHNLPDGMSPAQFRQLTQADSALGRIRLRAADTQQQLQQRQQELKELQDRLELLYQRVNLTSESDRHDEQIELLTRALQKSREQHQQRESLHRKWRDAGREQEKVAREAKRLRERRQQLVAKYGVVDAQELKAMVQRRAEAQKLRRQRDELLQQIATQLGSCCTVPQLRKDLERGNFEERLRGWEKDFDQMTARLAKLLEQRGELSQQVKHVTAQRQQSQKRLQMNEIETRLRRQCQQWQALAATSLVLDNVRKSYESDRQPGTLAEASGFLKRLSHGRYQRIWTPFGESSLCVDDDRGHAVQVEHLSRGTREQVFLSLRLALAADYSHRGASLPLILDDVFVNFDAQRAQYAAETICDFAAEGHQVLVFTCHDHIRDVFHRLGVDLRELPSAQTVANHPQPVLPAAPARPEPAVAPGEPLPAVLSAFDQELPTENDPELDHELLYGAPEYDPGYQSAPALPAACESDKRRSARRRRTASRRRRPAVSTASEVNATPLASPEEPPARWLERPRVPRESIRYETVPYETVFGD
jgi:uncharacterized protein YhaN